MHLIKVSEKEGYSINRNSIGGTAFLPEKMEIPVCQLCGEEMTLFFQFEIKPQFQLPFQSGSQLSVFMCPFHNDIPEAPIVLEGINPEEYKDQAPGHYKLFMFPPGLALIPKTSKHGYIEPRTLLFSKSEEKIQEFGLGIDSGIEAFKVGGQPSWINFCNKSKCSCGADMAFVCQLPENYGFMQSEGAPEQPDSFSAAEYCLFLGNIVFIMACTDNCSATSVLAECDN